MKERPILFSGPMVRVILAGAKTQTRRVVRNPERFTRIADCGHCCPYGQHGDRLWVRETWGVQTGQQPWSDGEWAGCYHGKLSEAPSDIQTIYRAGCMSDSSIEEAMTNGGGWRPSIHMPRWASRLTLEITGVRVERLREISEADAIAEGVECGKNGFRDYLRAGSYPFAGTLAGLQPAKCSFRTLWDSINAARGFGWDANPWVWVVKFKRVEPTPTHAPGSQPGAMEGGTSC